MALVQPLFSRSRLGVVRQRAVRPEGETLTWPAQYQPADNFRGHFEFGLKYERLNLEFFSRLLARIGPAEVAAWVQDEPTGRYARRTAFMYEWLTGQTLPAPDTAANVAYADAIDAHLYLIAQKPERVRRWRINNNLPGAQAFCPVMYLRAYDGVSAAKTDIAQFIDWYNTERPHSSLADQTPDQT